MTTTPLRNRARDPGPSIYYQDHFRSMVEAHIPWLREHRDTNDLPIEPKVAIRYQGDFFGLLTRLQFQQHLHWIIMRVNGLTNPMEYDHEMLELRIPSKDVLADLERLHTTTEVVE